MSHFVYILRCSDNSLYIGHAEDTEERLKRHNSGRGAAFTRSRTPVELVYKEELPTKADANRREGQLKCWSRAKKEALIKGDVNQLVRLSHTTP